MLCDTDLLNENTSHKILFYENSANEEETHYDCLDVMRNDSIVMLQVLSIGDEMYTIV